MATVLVIQWSDRDVPEVWHWPGDDINTERAADLQCVIRRKECPHAQSSAWIYLSKCGTRRMVLEAQCL